MCQVPRICLVDPRALLGGTRENLPPHPRYPLSRVVSVLWGVQQGSRGSVRAVKVALFATRTAVCLRLRAGGRSVRRLWTAESCLPPVQPARDHCPSLASASGTCHNLHPGSGPRPWMQIDRRLPQSAFGLWMQSGGWSKLRSAGLRAAISSSRAPGGPSKLLGPRQERALCSFRPEHGPLETADRCAAPAPAGISAPMGVAGPRRS